MAERILSRKIDSMEYDGLISGLTPAVTVKGGTLRALSAAATYKRGTVLAKSSVDGKLVILGTEGAAAVEASAAVYTKTSDVALTNGKTYYTKAGDVYTAVTSPNVANIGDYYELTTPAVDAADAEVLTPDCVLADDIDVGTAADENVAVYDAGCFDPNKLIVASDYTISDADIEALRIRNIRLVSVSD